MTEYHDCLREASRLMASISESIRILLPLVSDKDADADLFCDYRSAAKRLCRQSRKLDIRLFRAYSRMADRWNEIKSNEALWDEARRYTNAFLEFQILSRSFVISAQNDVSRAKWFCIPAEVPEEILRIMNETAMAMKIMTRTFSTERAIPDNERTDVSGLASALKDFVPGQDDVFYDRIINRRLAPEDGPVVWKGGKNPCARFARHFGMTDKFVNECFRFVKAGKVARPIKISSDITISQHPIDSILSNFPYKGKDRN